MKNASCRVERGKLQHYPRVIFHSVLQSSTIFLPDYFERELNVAGRSHRRLQTSATTQRSVRIENLGLSRAIKRQGRREVGVIQEIEKLRPELHGEGFRNLL